MIENERIIKWHGRGMKRSCLRNNPSTGVDGQRRNEQASDGRRVSARFKVGASRSRLRA